MEESLRGEVDDARKYALSLAGKVDICREKLHCVEDDADRQRIIINECEAIILKQKEEIKRLKERR